MIKKILSFSILGVLVIILVGCQPATDLPENSQPAGVEEETISTATAVAPTSLPPSSTPTLELEAAPQQPINDETIEETMPIKPTIPTPSNPAEAALIQQAMADLSQRLSVAEDQINLVEYKNVVWPDAGLGCPQPGMAYTQVQRDGYRILLQVGKRSFAYHGGGSRGPFLCENKADGSETLLPPPGLGNE